MNINSPKGLRVGLVSRNFPNKVNTEGKDDERVVLPDNARRHMPDGF